MDIVNTYTGTWEDVSNRIENDMSSPDGASPRLVSVMIVDGEGFIDAVRQVNPDMATREDAMAEFSRAADELWASATTTLNDIMVSYGITLNTDEENDHE